MRKIINCAKGIAFLLILLQFSSVSGQYAEQTLKKLASPSMQGRGYYKNGDDKAAEFIRKEFKSIGLQPVNGNYFQPFTFPVNTFPGKMKVTVGDKKLTAGQDYIVSPSCPTVKGEFNLVKATLPLQQFKATDFILIDKTGLDSASAAAMDSISGILRMFAESLLLNR